MGRWGFYRSNTIENHHTSFADSCHIAQPLRYKRFHLENIWHFDADGNSKELHMSVCQVGVVLWVHNGQNFLVLTFTPLFIYNLVESTFFNNLICFKLWLHKEATLVIGVNSCSKLLLENEIANLLLTRGFTINKETLKTVYVSIKKTLDRELLKKQNRFPKDAKLIFQISDTSFSYDFGALFLNSSCHIRTAPTGSI